MLRVSEALNLFRHASRVAGHLNLQLLIELILYPSPHTCTSHCHIKYTDPCKFNPMSTSGTYNICVNYM